MTDVGRISIMKLVIYFIVYVLIHIFIGLVLKNKQKEIEESSNPDYELIKSTKKIELFFKWFPAIYLVILVIILMIT